ncbi:hypothetical protein C4588_01370 [Candidatus Parcubacteria bacterium]|nr:MAG: hypothetical protein C4588_01370 [Candidatus Parcubacteria bacterium]
MIKCSFCGHEFNDHDSKSGCNGCPMSKTCNKSKCPNCGFEMPKEPGLIKFIKRKWGKKG